MNTHSIFLRAYFPISSASSTYERVRGSNFDRYFMNNDYAFGTWNQDEIRVSKLRRRLKDAGNLSQK